jgi:prolyl-tRNA synthetase
VPIGYHKNPAVRAAAERLHDELAAAGVDVLLDDRDERPGVLFADMELIGIPHRVVLSERGLAAGNAEYKGRRDEKPRDLPLGEVVAFLKSA